MMSACKKVEIEKTNFRKKKHNTNTQIVYIERQIDLDAFITQSDVEHNAYMWSEIYGNILIAK